ncbi:MAG: magnesium/cobalt transporter CorA [Candidatus Zixiibacteriota bacterium]|nr:magnesium/cobalt transporter CorA [candidate division Zixibacteria bacterium]MBU1471811.1 magnesium/cobalt transporter CorA [candidate division Zixibacteria bacterium]
MISSFVWNPEEGGREFEGMINFSELLTKKDHVFWVDLSEPTDEESYILTHDFKFHPLAIEDVLSEMSRPKVDDYEDYIFVVFLVASGRPGGEDDLPFKEIGLFLTRNCVVTVHFQRLKVIDSIFARLHKDERFISRGADFFFHTVLDHLADTYFQTLLVIEAETDKIEDDVFEDPDPEIVKRIFTIRRDVLQIKRTIAPLREVVAQFARAKFSRIGERTSIYFSDIYDHLARISDEADEHRDALNSSLEVYYSNVSTRTNEIIKFLTIFTAILLPPSFIVGFYGMNFTTFAPGLEWEYGYVFVLAIILMVVGGLLLFFRKRKWI